MSRLIEISQQRPAGLHRQRLNRAFWQMIVLKDSRMREITGEREQNHTTAN